MSAALALCVNSSSHAQVATALLREDGPLPGAPRGVTVGSISNPAVNQRGGYAFAVNTGSGTATLSHFWGHADGGPGTVLRTESTFGPLVQSAFESFFGMSDAGEFGYSASGSGGPAGSFDSVWAGDTPVAVEGAPVQSITGQYWVFASRPGITASGRVHWVGGFTSVQGGTTQNRGLFIDQTATPLLLGGQMVPHLPLPLNAGSTVGFDFRFSALGNNYITLANMAATTTTDGVIVINGEGLLLDGLLVREGSSVPTAIGGLALETWSGFGSLGINESGDHLITGDTSAATNQDGFVLINGQIAHREGDVLDGRTLTGAVESAFMNEQGDVAFVWPIVTDDGNRDALFINGRLALSAGDAVDLDGDGTIDPSATLSNFTGIAAFVLSHRDAQGNVRAYFTADVDTLGTPSTTDDTEGGFEFEFNVEPCPADLDDNAQVNVDDLLQVISNWGQGFGNVADITGTGVVNVDDLLALINAWGACR